MAKKSAKGPAKAGPKRALHISDVALRVPPPASALNAERWLEELELWRAGFAQTAPDSAGAKHLETARLRIRDARRALTLRNAHLALWAGAQAVHEMYLAMLADARPIIEKGVGAYRGKERHDAAEATALEDRRREWQIAADEIWQKNPKLSSAKVGAILSTRFAHSAKTIRTAIVKPAK